MIPVSTPSSRDMRMRKGHSQRKPLVRSNSSLLGSIKNFVAAPFARLFTGNAEEFEDSDDFSTKRRRIVNGAVDNNDIVEDGPAPAKRMRVRSPVPSPPPRSASAAYLDPPRSVFQQNGSHYLSNNPPGRSASISLPPTTLSDSSARHARSTLSPLRTNFSRNMSIDSAPVQQPRPLARDISMKSIPSASTLDTDISMRPVSLLTSRDHSLPPMTGRPSFRMRSSLTPQPHRDASEPPPLTALKSNPIFVRGPSHTSEPQPKPVATLGSLVESQRHVRSPTRQRTLLFGATPREVDPEAAASERALQELEFYKTPLIPTRIRSKMSNGLAATVSASNVTDMFSRKHPLILMGDHDRPSRGKRDKKNKDKVKEHNETKPYAGTTGIKKRLAKAKDVEGEENTEPERGNDSMDDDVVPTVEAHKAVKESVAQVPLPLPPLKEKDTFNVAAFPSTSRAAPQSSLRVGRAARSHLSRPTKKFSAIYDDEQDSVSDETKQDMELLEEAAKKVPVFEIPSGFSFAKDTKPIEHDAANAKEPPIPSLPFALSNPSLPAVTVATTPASGSTESSTESGMKATTPSNGPIFTTPSGSGTLFGTPSVQSSMGELKAAPTPAESSETERKIPDFFASSKILASQPPPPSSAAATSSWAPPTIPSSPVAPIQNSGNSSWEGEKRKSDNVAPSFGLGGQIKPPPLFTPSAPVLTPPPDFAQKSVTHPPLFAVSGQSQPTAETKPTSSLFSFEKPVENAQLQPTSGHSVTPLTFNSTPTTDVGPKASTPFSFAEPSAANVAPKAAAPFGSGDTSASSASADPLLKPPTPFSFASGAPADTAPKVASPFSFSSGTTSNAPAGETKAPTPFSFSTSAPASTLFGGSSEAAKSAPSAPFSFSQPSTSNSSVDTPKPLFGATNNFEASKPSFGNGSLGPSFAFSQSEKSERPKSPFSAPSSGNPESGNKSAPPFMFGPSASTPAASNSPFAFVGGATSVTNASKPFSFGAATPTRPVTPPNQVQEVRMEESPTREVQVNKPAEPRPSIGGFSFNSSSSLFGQNASSTNPASTGFSFGPTSSTSNNFGGMKTDQKSESKPFGAGGFGQSSTSSAPFGFARPQTADEPPRPSTTGSFTFGPSTPAPAANNSPFMFGVSNNNSTTNPFGQAQSGSAPNSPSTFGQTPSFSFGGASASSTANPFGFGSQPASPATPSTTLPQPSGVSGFGSPGAAAFGATSSGFGGGNSGGGNLFTIGAAPTNTDARQIKKLPNRRKR